MSTSAPFRLLVQQRITAALKEITVANGYVNDLSDVDGKARVTRGRGWFGADDPLPLVAILQPPHPVDPIESPSDVSEISGDWVLLIQGFVDDDAENPTDPAEVLMADVRKRLSKLPGENTPPGRGGGTNILQLGPANAATQSKGNSVGSLKLGRGVARPSDERSSKAYFWMLLIVEMNENAGNPYSE